MKIKEITRQSRRDFYAIFICEHCDFEEERSGYDDEYFHRKVIPEMVCKNCGRSSPENYRPLTTKYQDGETI